MFILTMVFFFHIQQGSYASNTSSITSIEVEYTSIEKCEDAKKINRENLQRASVILATCTRK